MSSKVKCGGPVEIMDQGIEYCETCNGCLCCGCENVDHTDAKYRCWRMPDGRCGLQDSPWLPEHVCEENSPIQVDS
jgi:hypothetical protein